MTITQRMAVVAFVGLSLTPVSVRGLEDVSDLTLQDVTSDAQKYKGQRVRWYGQLSSASGEFGNFINNPNAKTASDYMFFSAQFKSLEQVTKADGKYLTGTIVGTRDLPIRVTSPTGVTTQSVKKVPLLDEISVDTNAADSPTSAEPTAPEKKQEKREPWQDDFKTFVDQLANDMKKTKNRLPGVFVGKPVAWKVQYLDVTRAGTESLLKFSGIAIKAKIKNVELTVPLDPDQVVAVKSLVKGKYILVKGTTEAFQTGVQFAGDPAFLGTTTIVVKNAVIEPLESK